MSLLLSAVLFSLELMAAGMDDPPGEKVYINRLDIPVRSVEEAVGWTIRQELDSGRVVDRTYYLDGQLKSESPLLMLRGHLLAHGTESFWSPQGQLMMQAEYQYGRLHGPLRTWYPDGQLRREEEYSVSLLQRGCCLDQQGKETACPELYAAARFAGGAEGLQRYIDHHLHYPLEAMMEAAEGTVQVRLLLDSLGQPEEAMTDGRYHPDIEAEAIRLAMSMPRWEPARMEGQPVSEVLELQIPFRLDDYTALYTPKVIYEYRQLPGDTVYFDSEQRMVVARHAACEYMVTEEVKHQRCVQKTWSMEHTLLEEVHYEQTSFMSAAMHGPWRKWNRQGQQLLELNHRHGHLHGPLLTWWPNGQLKRQDEYRNSKLKSGACYDAQGNEVPHFPYLVHVEFPGGDEGLENYLATELIYPGLPLVLKKSGTVLVQFVIDKEGNVSHAAVLQGVYPELDQEALRVVNAMPRWQPQVIDGEPQEMTFMMPVNFVLNLEED